MAVQLPDRSYYFILTPLRYEMSMQIAIFGYGKK